MDTDKLIPVAFVTMLGVIAWQDYKRPAGALAGIGLPQPSRVLSAGIVFGILGVLESFAPFLAGALAVGVVVGTLVNGADLDAKGLKISGLTGKAIPKSKASGLTGKPTK